MRSTDGNDIDEGEFEKTLPIKRPFWEHVKHYCPSDRTAVLEDLLHNEEVVELRSSAAATTHVYLPYWERKGGIKYYNRARVEIRVVRTEDNQMKGYLNLCAMESNLLSDPSYLHPETRVARQAMAVALLIRQLRWGWFHVNEGNILDAAKRAAKYSVPRFHYDSVLRWYRDYRSNSCEGFTASRRGMAAKFCIVNDAHEDLIADINST